MWMRKLTEDQAFLTKALLDNPRGQGKLQELNGDAALKASITAFGKPDDPPCPRVPEEKSRCTDQLFARREIP